MDNPWLWTGALCCLIPFVVLGVVLWRVAASGGEVLGNLLNTDPLKVQAQFDKARSENPTLDADALSRRIIHQQAMKCGWIGALTSFGGVFTLPIALPIDLITSLQAQATMVDMIAKAQQYSESEEEHKTRTWLIAVGGERLAGVGVELFSKLVLGSLPKFASKIVPFVGALIGFAVNYGIARGSGEAALLWYKRKQSGRPAHAKDATASTGQ
jgi:hypothetical protein